MNIRPSHYLPIIFYISTILFLAFFAYVIGNAFSLYLYKHTHYPPNIPDIMAILSFLPCIIAVVGLLLKRKWAYLLTTIMLFYFGSFFICYVYMKGWVNSAPRIVYVFAGLSYAFGIFFLCNKNLKDFFGLKSLIDIPFSKLLAVSIIIMIVAEFFIVKRYLYYQQVIFPPPIEQNAKQHKHLPFLVDKELKNEDIEQILKILKQEKEERHMIYRFSQIQEDAISVNVGELRGPLNADGFSYMFKKFDGKWKLVDKSWWIS